MPQSTIKKGRHKKQNVRTGPSGQVILFVVYFIVFVPLIYSKATIDPVVFPRFVALAVGLAAVMVFFLVRKQKIQTGFFYALPVLFLGLYVLLSAVSLLFAINPIEGLADLMKWCLVFILVFVIYHFDPIEDEALKYLVKGVIISSLIAILIGFYQYFNDAFQNDDPNALYEVSGLMAHKNQFSIALFLMLPFLVFASIRLRSSWRKAAWIAVGGVFLMIAVLQTRAVWIALAFSFVIFAAGWMYLKSKSSPSGILSQLSGKTMFSAAVMIVIIGAASFIFTGENPAKRIGSVFDTRNTSNEWRIEMWAATLDLVEDHPLTGVGGGNWKIDIYPYYGRFQPSVYRHWRNPHNDFLLISAEKGIPGLLVYLLFYFSLFVYGIRVIRKSESQNHRWLALMLTAIIPGFLVISFFSFPAERVNHLMYLGIISGLLVALRIKSSDITTTKSTVKGLGFYIPAGMALVFILYFGIVTIRSEVHIALAQKLKDSPKTREFARHANKGYSPIVPFEPRYSFPVVNYRGLASYKLNGNHQQALDYFKQAYQQHPANFAVINNVGSVYGQMGQYDSSIAYYQKTLDIFSHYERGLINMAKAWYLKKDYRKAYYYILCCDPKSSNIEIKRFRAEIEKKLD